MANKARNKPMRMSLWTCTETRNLFKYYTAKQFIVTSLRVNYTFLQSRAYEIIQGSLSKKDNKTVLTSPYDHFERNIKQRQNNPENPIQLKTANRTTTQDPSLTVARAARTETASEQFEIPAKTERRFYADWSCFPCRSDPRDRCKRSRQDNM